MNEENKKYVQITEEEYNKLLESRIEYVKITREEYDELKKWANIGIKYKNSLVKGAKAAFEKQFENKTKEEIAEEMRERARKSHEARRRNKALKQSDE